MQFICKYYTCLYEELEHSWILVSVGVRELIPRYQGTTVVHRITWCSNLAVLHLELPWQVGTTSVLSSMLQCWYPGFIKKSQYQGNIWLFSLKERDKSPLHKHLTNMRFIRMESNPLGYILSLAPSPSLYLPPYDCKPSVCGRLALKSNRPDAHYLELSKNGPFYFRKECQIQFSPIFNESDLSLPQPI